MKGEELEHLRFQHPLYARDSLGGACATTSPSNRGPAPCTRPRGTAATTSTPASNTDWTSTHRSTPAGTSSDTVELFGGKRVFDANPDVEAALKERGRLWHREPFHHSYPHCWRCHNPVIFLATSQWFIALEQPIGGAQGGDARTLRKAALDAIDRRGPLDPHVGPRPHLQHGREPARLVHLAPARLGSADPRRRLHEVR